MLKPDILGAGVVRVAHHQVQEDYNLFVTAMLDWTGKDRGERRSLIGVPWDFAAWLDGTKYAPGRMLRHALLFLLFPDTFEPIVSSSAKKAIVNNLGGSNGEDAVAIDRQLLKTRGQLEREALRLDEPADVHFYRSPYWEMWDFKRADDWFRGRFGDGDARVWVMNMNIDGERMWPGVAEDGIASIGWDKVPDLREFKSRDELVST